VGHISINGMHKERKKEKKRAPTCSMVGWKISLDSLLFFFLLLEKLIFFHSNLMNFENKHQMERERKNLRSMIIDIIYIIIIL
jgi:hypothetical protein